VYFLLNLRGKVFLISISLYIICIGISDARINLTTSPKSFSAPIGRFGHAMVYDPINKQVILFGGTADNSLKRLFNDTWIYRYSENMWININVTNKPSARMNHGMVYDTVNQKVILFGGLNAAGNLIDTWIFDPQKYNWTRIYPEVSPPAKSDRAMFYDPINQKVVLFGGFLTKDDTWVYDYANNSWVNINPSFKPNGRYGHTLIYDPINQRGLLFGGRTPIGVVSDTWAYNYTNNSWTEVNTTNKPDGRYWHTMVYDSNNEKGILFGGYGTYPEIFNDTWEYDLFDNTWIKLNPIIKPWNRVGHAMIHDSENQKTILFGGAGLDLDHPYNDTWIYDGITNKWNDVRVENNQIKNTSSTTNDLTTTTVENNQTTGFNHISLITSLAIIIIIKKRKT